MPGIVALGIAYVFSQFYRGCLAVLAPYLTADLGLDDAALGEASGIWFLLFALMQIPVGVGLDRLGPRRTDAWLFGLCGAGGAAVFALAQGANGIIFGMALMGAGCAPALMALFYIFARNHSPARFATLSSITVGLGTLGNIAGTEPFALLVEAIGWRETMGLFAAISAVTALAILALVKDPPRMEAQAHEAADRGFREYFALLKLPIYWPLLPMAMMNYTPPAGIRGLWAGPYLSEVFGLSAGEVGRATLWMAIAMSLGAFVYGPLDRIFGTRKWVVMVGTLGSAAACFALGATAGMSADLSVALMAAIGLVGATYTVVMAHGRALAPMRLVGRAVTMMNFFVMVGVGAGQAATGWAITALRDSGASASAAYGQLFMIYGGVLLLAAFVYLFSRDAKP